MIGQQILICHLCLKGKVAMQKLITFFASYKNISASNSGYFSHCFESLQNIKGVRTTSKNKQHFNRARRGLHVHSFGVFWGGGLPPFLLIPLVNQLLIALCNLLESKISFQHLLNDLENVLWFLYEPTVYNIWNADRKTCGTAGLTFYAADA